jgi:hypothetical protein
MKTAKKVWMIILVSTVVIGLVPAISSMPVIAASGNGSNGKFIAPIEAPVAGSTPISNRAQLEAIRNNLYGNYYLTADIDLSGAEWVPIGTISGNAIEDTDISNFSGTFDGQGHVIRNMKITGEGYEWSGLFGYTYSATIKNVGMENTNISIARSAGAIAGGICGHACDTSISNCYNTGCVSASSLPCDYYTGAWSGGICGYTIESNIDSCYNTGSVSALSSNPVANPYAGGICGYFSDIYSIKNCYNTGSVTASYSSSVSEYWHSADAGGICGRCSANISNCYNAGTESAFSSSAETTAGGICGSTVHSGACGGPFGSVADCYNTGEVSASSPFSRVSEGLPYSAVGGICGYNTGEMNNCYNVGPLSASSAYTPSLGGICGSPVSSDEIGNCYCLNLYDNSYGKQ